MKNIISNIAASALKSFNCIFLLAVLALNTSPVKAQSVDSLVNEALRNNIQLKALESRVKSAEASSRSQGYLPPPTVGLEFSQVPFTDPDPLNNAISQNLSFSQMFMLGGKLSAMEEAEKGNIPVAQSDVENYKARLVSQVKTKYYQLWMSEHHIALREDIISLLQGLINSSEQRYATGSARYSDLLMIKAEIASNNSQLKILQNDYEAASYEMNALLGRTGNSEFVIQHNWDIDSLRYNEQELADILTGSNPELKKMDAMLKMNRLESVANNKELYPDLMVQGMVMRMPRGMILTGKSSMEDLGMGETEYMFSVMASVTLPFMPWSSGKYNAREQELSNLASGLSSERANMQLSMLSNLKAMLKKLESLKIQIELYNKEVLPLYRQALQAQTSEFQNSRLAINDLLNTMQMLLMKEEELSESKMQYQMTFSEIEAMTGQRL